jgi:dTMP kinase
MGTTAMPSSPATSAGRFAALSATTAIIRERYPVPAGGEGNVVPVSDPDPAPAGTAEAHEQGAGPTADDRRQTPTKLGFGGVMRSRGFRRLLLGQTVSSLGDWVATLAFIAAAFALTSNQTAVAVVLILRLVPPIFAAPVGGVFADRFDRRVIMVTCDLSRAALIVLVPFVGIGLLYAIAFVHECISLFFLPARDASVPRLVRRENLEEANGLVLATSYGTLPIAAAAFSGLAVAAGHIPGGLPLGDFYADHPTTFAFFFDAATFLFSASMIARLPLMPRERPEHIALLAGVREGFAYVLHHPGLRSLAYGLVVSMFGGGVLFAIGIAFIHQTLDGTDAQFGWLASLWGVGMGVGLAVVRLLVRRGESKVFVVAVAACGGILIVMAVFPYLWLSFILAVVFGAAFSVAIVIALTLVQRETEDEIRGRIMGGVQMLFRVGLGLGALGMGAIAHGITSLDLGLIELDGNQVGLIVGGSLIIFGAFAATGALRASAWTDGEKS